MTRSQTDNLKISEFWEWFSGNCEHFGKDFDNEELLNELDIRIGGLGDFAWEMGPGKLKENALVISPGGDADLLEGTRRIVKCAGEQDDWEFYYAKPPKEWELRFNFNSADNKIVEIDGSQWEYVLLRYEDGMFEIIIRTPALNGLGESDKRTAAEILLDGILGEEERIQTISSIDVVEEFEWSYKGKTSNIKNLPDHLNTL